MCNTQIRKLHLQGQNKRKHDSEELIPRAQCGTLSISGSSKLMALACRLLSMVLNSSALQCAVQRLDC